MTEIGLIEIGHRTAAQTDRFYSGKACACVNNLRSNKPQHGLFSTAQRFKKWSYSIKIYQEQPL